MASEVIREMREIVSNGNAVAPEVAYRLIISGQIELHDSIERLAATVVDTDKRLTDKIDHTERRLAEVERKVASRSCPNIAKLEEDIQCVIRRLDTIKENPSLIWLFRNKTKQTIATIVGITFLLHMIFNATGPLAEAIIKLLGVF